MAKFRQIWSHCVSGKDSNDKCQNNRCVCLTIRLPVDLLHVVPFSIESNLSSHHQWLADLRWWHRDAHITKYFHRDRVKKSPHLRPIHRDFTLFFLASFTPHTIKYKERCNKSSHQMTLVRPNLPLLFYEHHEHTQIHAPLPPWENSPSTYWTMWDHPR